MVKANAFLSKRLKVNGYSEAIIKEQLIVANNTVSSIVFVGTIFAIIGSGEAEWSPFRDVLSVPLLSYAALHPLLFLTSLKIIIFIDDPISIVSHIYLSDKYSIIHD